MQSTRIYKEFEQLNNNEKQLYAKGFKLAYNLLQIKEKNKNVHDLISTIVNYKSKSMTHIDKNDDSIEKCNNLLKRKNKELLQKFETIIKICPHKKKPHLVHSLQQYLLYDKKYNDSFSLLKNLKNDIKENKSSNVWVNQMKYIKVVNYYKQKLQIAHDQLHKIISSMNNEISSKTTNEVNIKTNINKKNVIKTLSFDDNSDIADLNDDVHVKEEVGDVEEPVQEHEEPVQEEVVEVEETAQEHVEPVQEEVVEVEETAQEHVEPVQEEIVKVEEEPTTKKKDSDETKPKKARKPRKKKEDGEEKKPKKTRKPRKKKEEVKTEDN